MRKGLKSVTLVVVAAIFCLQLLAVAMLRFVPPASSMMMLSSDVQPVHHRWVPWQRIAPAVELAVVAAEDQKFPFHHGFDFPAIREALEHNQRSLRIIGGSTISQQTAKNLFLWRSRSYLRKFIEAVLTGELELFCSKRRILELYLNIAQFGPDVYGVEMAAERYFHRPAAELNRRQAALLAAALPFADRAPLERDTPYLQQRADEIEIQMQQLGPDYLDSLY
jgi:monofunctional biosynthetic peptidoglycan transglycosylase